MVIGSRLFHCSLLAETKKNGKALEDERVQFIKGDLSSIEELRQAFQSVDAVVHAGALSTAWGPWKAFYQANVVGTQNVLELCREYAVKRLVYVSSPSIYAAGKDQLNIMESDAPKRKSPQQLHPKQIGV